MKYFFDLGFEEFENYILNTGEKKFRASQVFDWVYKEKVYDFINMTNLPVSLRENLSRSFDLNLPVISEKQESPSDGTVKYLFRLSDGELIESVYMKYHFGNSICVSSQVGCRMGCAFCASTKAGFIRNLTPGELAGQIIAAEDDCGCRISNITVMGIGEPLDNFDNLVAFIRNANDSHALGKGIRSFTISTCGIPERIRELADTGLKVNLALSLHSADSEKRAKIMPVAVEYSIQQLMSSMRYYSDKTGRKPTYEYIVIDGFNDAPQDARLLSELLKGQNALVNLIRHNQISGSGIISHKSDAAVDFANMLINMGTEVTIRRRLGADIDAACGQLRRKRSTCD